MNSALSRLADHGLAGARTAALAGTSALVAAACWLATATNASAAAVTTAQVTAELVSEQRSVRPGEPFTVGLSLRPVSGWHTYWQNPGNSGLPTTIAWKLPAGLSAGELEWPHPVRLSEPPVVTYGYEGDALLLTRIDASESLRAGSEVELAASARWLACRDDACVPGKAELALRLRVDTSPPARDPGWTEAFDAARARLPRTVEGWSASPVTDGDRIRIEVAAPGRAETIDGDVHVFPTVTGFVESSAATSVRTTPGGFLVELTKDEKADAVPDRFGLVLVAGRPLDAAGSVRVLRLDAQGANAAASPAPIAAAPAAAAEPGAVVDATGALDAGGSVTFWAAIGLAFLGGLVLNLMPCVFPVLSLKVLGFVHLAHHEPVAVRRHGYAFAAGVIASFWILAGALLILRAAGGVLGWGFQLQEPLFVAAIAALLLAMSLNLFGVFEFGSQVASAAGRFDSEQGYRGSFLSGVLATVLATPCSAPFMGTAIGYALAQPPFDALAVFTSLGAGMAAPYLVFACAPSLLRALPRPGAWMETFRALMAFPLLATVAWLVWVFGQQTGNDGVLRLLLALLLGSMALWLVGRFQGGRARAAVRTFGALLAASAVFLVVTVAPTHAPPEVHTAASHTGAVQWTPWDPDAIEKHRSQGRVVFVDFTADWCLSCKVNERVALAGDDFASMLRTHEAVAMKADWTRADPRITEALATFGRSAVPLYVVYPPDTAREPIVLPQILTPGIVREAFQQAVS